MANRKQCYSLLANQVMAALEMHVSRDCKFCHFVFSWMILTLNFGCQSRITHESRSLKSFFPIVVTINLVFVRRVTTDNNWMITEYVSLPQVSSYCSIRAKGLNVKDIGVLWKNVCS